MNAKRMTHVLGLAAIGLAVTAAGCGQYLASQGRSPTQLVINRLSAAPGNDTNTLSEHLQSDVITIVRTTPPGTTTEIGVPTYFNDVGSVAMTLVLKDQGASGVTTDPSRLNQVTISRYRVVYRRTDGRNTPGVDVPQPFESGLTFTVTQADISSAGFQLVRSLAKREAPLAALASLSPLNPVLISTIADVTFFGRDLAGNDVSVTGSIGIDFGNFGDPD